MIEGIGADVMGILGHHVISESPRFEAMMTGTLTQAETDPDSIGYFALAPEYIADAILHAIDQPWGVSVGSITVRATDDSYIL